VTGAANGHEVAVGNAALFTGLRMPLTAIGPEAETLRAEGATTVLVAIDGRLAGVIAVADPIKASIPAVLESLRQAGIRIVMVTGDHRAPAEAVARKLGITDIEAEALPEHKNAIVQRLRAQGRAVAMAGDGVNDAPALAEAEVGIVLGTGAAGALYPAFGLLLSPIIAAAAMSFSSVSVIGNALRLRFVRL